MQRSQLLFDTRLTTDEIKLFRYLLNENLRKGLPRDAEMTRIDLCQGTRTFQWVLMKMDCSMCCAFTIVGYSNCWRIKASHSVQPSRKVPLELFRNNALAVHGLRELTLTKNELLDPSFIQEFAQFLAKVVQGEICPISIFEHERNFPDYAWTRQAKAHYEAHLQVMTLRKTLGGRNA